jgi:hypothetical protein
LPSERNDRFVRRVNGGGSGFSDGGHVGSDLALGVHARITGRVGVGAVRIDYGSA